MIKYGFLGIGIMGQAMAANLLQAGFEVTVWNRTLEKCTPLVDMGAQQRNTPAEVVADCDLTFAMVADPAASEAIFFGEGGVLEAIAPGKSYIDVSTVDPDTPARIGRAVEEKGGRFLEAPVFGTRKPAEEGTLVFLCAGDESLYRDAAPALEAMGKKSFFFSQIGQGAQMKLIVNMIMGSMMTAFCEGLALGDKVGLQMAEILQVLSHSTIDNPMFRLKGASISENRFQTSFPLKHMQKDLRLAQQMADTAGQSLLAAAIANNAFLKARAQGFGDEDFAAVMKIIRD